jgi:hypothetical protein
VHTYLAGSGGDSVPLWLLLLVVARCPPTLDRHQVDVEGSSGLVVIEGGRLGGGTS